MNSTIDPKELLQAHTDGDTETIGRYITQLADIIMNKHYPTVPFTYHADLKQDAILHMLEALPKYDTDKSNLFSYLYNVGKNHIYDKLNTESYKGQIKQGNITHLDPTAPTNQAILKGGTK